MIIGPCACCGRDYIPSIPGLMWMDTFYRRKCNCGCEVMICTQCVNLDQIKGKYKCKSCDRDIKIEKILE